MTEFPMPSDGNLDFIDQQAQPRTTRGMPRASLRAEQDTQIYQMRVEGMTVPDIARKMGMTTRRVYAAIRRRFNAIVSNNEETMATLIQLDVDRLDAMFSTLYRQAVDPSNPRAPRAAEVAIRLLERKAKLLGLDAPEKTQIDVNLHMLSDQELRDEGERMRILVPHIEVPKLLPGEIEKEPGQIVIDADFGVIDEKPGHQAD